jgi:GntR family transcriptional regulator
MLYSVQVGCNPIYRQIISRITHQVASGKLVAGTKIPSVRDLASELVINPMTVSKAYTLLVDAGVLARTRGGQLTVASLPLPEGVRIEILTPYLTYIREIAHDLGLSNSVSISLN